MISKMIGGGLKSVSKDMGENKQLFMFVMGILVLLLKTYMVQWAYNKIWPKLVVNSGQDASRFVPLNFHEAFLVVILFSFL